MIKAIILDGFHKGHVLNVEYMPIIRLLKPRSLKFDYCCDQGIIVDTPISEDIYYKECFRGVDKNVVLYSEKGDSRVLLHGLTDLKYQKNLGTNLLPYILGIITNPLGEKMMERK